MTSVGVLLGTAAYMAPEQARGAIADRRADVWAFGCVLYEMLTGRRAFHGATVTEVLGAILHAEPDWTALPADTPASIRRVLRRCLQKALDRRLHSLADAVLDIDEALDPAIAVADGSRRTPTRSAHMLWAIAAVAGAAAAFGLGWATSLGPAALPSVSRLVVPLAGPIVDNGRPVVALTTDGSRLAYVAAHDAESLVHVRPVDGFESAPLAATRGATSAFFSPDGEWVGFYSGGRIRKVSIRGGPPLVVAQSQDFSGASWVVPDTIHFSTGGALYSVPSAGGTPTLIPDPAGRPPTQLARFAPHVLPGGRAMLFTANEPQRDQGALYLRRLDSGAETLLVPDSANGAYVDGFLLFGRHGTVFAVPFDVNRLELTGTPVPVVERVHYNRNFITTQFSVSQTGRVAYVPGSESAERQLAVIDRAGVITPIVEMRRPYFLPRFSPDGRRIAVTVLEDGVFTISVIDPARGSAVAVATAAADAIWSPDGKRLAYASLKSQGADLVVASANGQGAPVSLLSDQSFKLPTSWSRDGRWIAFTRQQEGSGTGEDVYIIGADGTAARPLLQSADNETGGTFSPDGRWLAYASGDLGRLSVYVASVADPGVRWRVDRDGGYMPQWSPDGRELFFVAGVQFDRLMGVAVTAEGANLRLSAPRRVLDYRFGTGIGFGISRYDVAPDGRRFIFATPESVAPPATVRLLLDWRAHLERVMSAK